MDEIDLTIKRDLEYKESLMEKKDSMVAMKLRNQKRRKLLKADMKIIQIDSATFVARIFRNINRQTDKDNISTELAKIVTALKQQ